MSFAPAFKYLRSTFRGLCVLVLIALVADPAVISFCQGASLAAGSLLSLALLRALARRPWPALWPQSAAVALLTAQLWALIV